MSRILVIDDNSTMREGVVEILLREGYEVHSAANGEEGIHLFRELLPDFVITDLKMDGLDGLEVLQRIRVIYPDAIVMVMTAFGTIDRAVEAMKLGAFDFITKPFSLELLKAKVKQGLHVSKLSQENIFFKSELASLKTKGMVGSSPQLGVIREQIAKVAPSDASVLITGESGTGKELIARDIHLQSLRAQGPFIKTDCTALAEGVLESELFGHEKGAFTGASQRKIGRFELAHKGTIFLDEIGEIPHTIQLKLLRVLQDRSFERVGGTRPIQVDVRIISATNKNLQEEVRKGNFREDLFYRLHVVPIHVPPLRERKTDIPELVQFFIKKWSGRLGKDLTIHPDASARLSEYSWPGNIRELENFLERLVILSSGNEIRLSDLPSEQNIRPDATQDKIPWPMSQTLDEALESLEKQYILMAYTKCQGVKTKMAQALGIKPSALYYKMEKYGIH